MRRASNGLLLLLLAAAIVPLNCRRATGSAADPLDAEARRILTDYVRIDTSNPPGNETAGATWLRQLLAKEGIESQLLGNDPNRQSLYARLRSGTNEKALVLLHHIDVVPAATSDWTKPPFGAVESGGYLFGRGALDIKSLGVAELMAMIELKRRKTPLRRDVIYLAVADEEAGGLHGCKALLDEHPDLFANAGFVLNEGGYNETIVDKVAFWGIETQQKLPLWLRVRVSGAPGHGAAPPDDGGTIGRLITALGKIQAIETPYRMTPAAKRYFATLAKTKNDYRGDAMRALTRGDSSIDAAPIDVAQVKKSLSPGYRSLLHDTIAITRVNGGTSLNSLPAHATADLDIRLLPDETPDAMIATIRSAVAEAAGKRGEVEVLLSSPPVPESSADTELFRVLTRELQKAEPGSAVGTTLGGGTSDSRFFRAKGITAYGIAPFKVNYYDADTVHGNDERIRLNFFTEGTRLVRAIVREFCARER
jgi:acetylornithine deacetylase/succinyl-diaminopimelate desuccinylase-like protein